MIDQIKLAKLPQGPLQLLEGRMKSQPRIKDNAIKNREPFGKVAADYKGPFRNLSTEKMTDLFCSTIMQVDLCMQFQ